MAECSLPASPEHLLGARTWNDSAENSQQIMRVCFGHGCGCHTMFVPGQQKTRAPNMRVFDAMYIQTWMYMDMPGKQISPNISLPARRSCRRGLCCGESGRRAGRVSRPRTRKRIRSISGQCDSVFSFLSRTTNCLIYV